MDSANKFRRSAFVDPVWARVQSGGLSVVLSKLASLAILVGLLVVAWVAFSFVRTGLATTSDTVQPDPPAQPTARAAEVATVQSPQKREPIVYIAASDPRHYHQCGHAPSDSPRQAVPASLARSRGYSPCPSCFRR